MRCTPSGRGRAPSNIVSRDNQEVLVKKHKNDKHRDDVAANSAEAKKARNKAYEKEIARLQVEIAYLQAWVPASGARIVIIFEGRDAAGKGGVVSGSSSGSARGCSVWWRCRHRATARRARCTSSATWRSSRRRARS